MRSPIVFKTTHRPRFSQLDPWGHLNTEYYLSHFLEHRFTGCREQANLGLAEIAKLPIVFVVTSVHLTFRRSIIGDEEFVIESRVTEISEKTCVVECELKKTNMELASTCKLEFTCLDKKTNRSTPWPEGFMDRFFSETK